MKNILLKLSILFVFTFIFIGSNLFVNAQNFKINDDNINSIYYMDNDFDKAYNNNYQNHFIKNNDKMHMYTLNNFLPFLNAGFAGLSIIITIFGLVLLAFWIWMLIHAIKHDIDYKPVWILVLWFLNIFGAIIYYYAVKKQCPCCQSYENVCICDGDGVCKCGPVSSEEVADIKKEMEN